jgi:RHS repeat-associated protein
MLRRAVVATAIWTSLTQPFGLYLSLSPRGAATTSRTIVEPRSGGPGTVPFCQTYITITQYPPSLYYQTTAVIVVGWGEIITENPTCLSLGGPDPSTFTFTVNGAGQTLNFLPDGSGASGTVTLTNGVTNTLVASILGNDTQGNPRTDTDTKTTFVNASAQPMAPVVEVGGINPGPIIERDLCLTIAAGSDGAYECGDLRIVHALPSVRTLGRERVPTLLFNSDHAYPWPLVGADVRLPAGAMVPDSVVGVLKVGGVQRARGRWTGSDWSAGQARRIVLGFGAVSDPTGVYSYTYEVTNFYGTTGYAPSTPATGQFIIVNRSASPFGAGWWLAGLEQLNPATKLWVGGDGSARVYGFVRVVGGDTTWAAPNVDRPDTLKWIASLGRYVSYLPHGVQVRFDVAGRHVATVSRLGHQTKFTYNTSGNLDAITLPPASYEFNYSFIYTAGLLSSVSSPGPRATIVTMNAGRIASIRDPDLSTVSFGFDPVLGLRIRTRTDRRGTVTTYDYDQTGRKLAMTTIGMVSQANIVTYYGPAELKGQGNPSWDTAQVYTRLVGPRVGVAMNFWVDRFGVVRKIEDPLGNITRLTRSSGMWPAAVTRMVRYLNPDSQVVVAAYDNLGLVSSVTDSSFCQGGTCATTRYQYDPAWGFVTLIAPPMGDSLFFGYDPVNGNRLWQRDRRGDSTRVNFYYGNTFSLLSHIQTPTATARDSFTYDGLGNLGSTRTSLGYVTSYENDAIGLPWRVTSPEGVQTSTYRNLNSERDTLTVTSGPLRSVSNDQVWNPLSWFAASASLKRIYDAEGNLIESRRWSSTGDIGTIVEQTHFDRANRAVATISADLLKDSVVYDDGGNPIRLITRRGQTIEQDFDAWNRLIQRRTPTVTYAAQTFQGASFPSKTISGDTARFYYDAAGRDTLALNRFARTRRVYDRSGHQQLEEQRIRSWSALANSTWNTAGFDQHVYAVGYAYDLDGRRTVLAHPAFLGPGNDTTRFGYYRFGPDSTITDPYGSVFRFFYDAEGRLDSLYNPNTTGEKWRYDADGRLQHRTVRSPTSTFCGTGGSGSCFPNNIIRADTITYSLDGRITEVRNAGRELFQLDYTGLGQVGRSVESYFSTVDNLYHWTRREYFWPDALGNMVKRSIVTSPSDAPQDTFAYSASVGRLTQQADLIGGSWGWQPASHDSSGNLRLTSRFQLASQCTSGDALRCTNRQAVRYQTVTSYWYDAEQRLVASHRKLPNAATPTGEQVGGQEEYWYDAHGRRILRYWLSDAIYDYGLAYVEPYLYRYVWDGDQILYEIRTQASTPCLDSYCVNQEYGWVGYVHGPAIDTPLEAFRGDGGLEFNRMFLHANWRGTITLGSRQGGEEDIAPLQMVDWQRSNLSTYGERQSTFTSGVYPRWFGSFLSRQSDGSKLQYLRNRYYDPNNGRFTQEDPIGLVGGLNLYGFAGGDPINFSDPFGLATCPPHCTRIHAIGAGVGGVFGTVVGASGGAVAGTAVLPIAGTLGGGVAGGVAGAAEGATVGVAVANVAQGIADAVDVGAAQMGKWGSRIRAWVTGVLIQLGGGLSEEQQRIRRGGDQPRQEEVAPDRPKPTPPPKPTREGNDKPEP